MSSQRKKQVGITFGYCDVRTGQRVYLTPGQTAPPIDESPQTKIPDLSSVHNGAMYCKVTTWPALGQSTIVTTSDRGAHIAVLLETSTGLGHDGTQVSLWHNQLGESNWSESKLTLSNEYKHVLPLNRLTDDNLQRVWFEGDLPRPPKENRSVRFTVKFKFKTDASWRRVKDSISVDDGELIYRDDAADVQIDKSASSFFENISTDIKFSAERPETDNTILFSLSCPVQAVTGEDSAYAFHRLGRAIRCSRWFALVRLWSPWLAPRHGKGDRFHLDHDGILLSFLRNDGLHVVCLAVSGAHDIVMTFQHDEDGNVIIKARSDSTAKGSGTVLMAVADSFEVANAAVFYHARKVVANSSGQDPSITPSEKLEATWMEEWYDGLTYCTWNALGQKLSAKKIIHALDELSKNRIKITNLIIDDNWQSLSEGETALKRGWTEFEANREGFPSGLKDTVTEIREKHPNVQHVAVWHALYGYWGGIDPHGEIAQRYRTQVVQIEPGAAEGQMTVVAAEDVQRMYNDFYSFLSLAGVDAVKTDAQFFIDMMLHASNRRALSVEYQDAWSIAHLRHFSGRAISCMSQTPQSLFHSQMPTNKPRIMVRNSDDFFPQIAASHPWHIFANAHNSLFTQHLNVLPDWDMFQTSHEWASFHAAARCVSGGPIYITDYPGQHDVKLIAQMTAQTTLGKSIVLRPHRAGKTINAYNKYESEALLKIGTYVGMAQTGAGILGVFNVSESGHSEVIRLMDVPGTEKGEYVIGSFGSGRLTRPWNRQSKNCMITVELGVREWDILTAYPVRRFVESPGKPAIALLGLLYKMTGCAAVTGYNVQVESNGRFRLWASLKALGVLGIWMSDLADRSVADDFMIMILGRPIPAHCVRKNEVCTEVLEVDIARAWEQNQERPGWNNEVSVEVFVNKRYA